MYWIKGKPLHCNHYTYLKEKQNSEDLSEALRLISNHIIKPNVLIAAILLELKNHEYFYIFEDMKDNVPIKSTMKNHSITESQYFKCQKDFFLLFYQLYKLKVVDIVETR